MSEQTQSLSEMNDDELLEDQMRIAREIGEELTDAFVAYVRGDVPFDDLVFGLHDALNDLHVVASGEYEIEELDNEEFDEDDIHDHDHESHNQH